MSKIRLTNVMNKIVRYLSRKVVSFLGLAPLKEIERSTISYNQTARNIQIDNYLKEHLFEREKYISSKRINRFEYNIYSQNGEDGIIQEIFKRIETSNKYFVEFGVHGVKNNTTLLLLNGWNGLWIEGSNEGFDIVNQIFENSVRNNDLKILKGFITAENIESLFNSAKVPADFDYLSIDIDGNDYWVWKAIENFRPRVVQIEYNSTLRESMPIVMDYNPKHYWNGTSYFGAGLKALEELGESKGYVLIGCDFSGTNAFFVRKTEDLKKFESPFTSENHYEPPRYFLQRDSGHKIGFGNFTNVRQS